MPLTKLVADALGVVTITLVAISSLIGSLCILYSFYFRSHIRTQGYNRLKYFSGPWVIRIIFILFTIWWGLGEILRLDFIRQEGRLLNSINQKWQDIVCKSYIISNLGFSEPCLFLTLVFLLRASLQKTESGPLSQNFNLRTTIYIFLFCFPILALQTIVVVLGHHYETGDRGYFFRITSEPLNNVSRCYYPLMSTTLLGLFATLLNIYLCYLGRKILHLVINKGLRKRVFILIITVSSFFPLRILLLGLSVLSKPGDTVFEVLAFLAFLSLLCCAEVAVCFLVYYPIADSLELKNLQDIEDRRRIIEEYNDTLLLIANQSPVSGTDSGKQGSISFRTMEREENPGAFVELSLFSPSQRSSPVGSPRLSGWPMLPTTGGG
ncbi:hypothetical protein L1887_40209 [Cichorium endivia]|nr:hypothetical protein L1887_40209 [Cichorium endivia]